jgi:hypothetical protein
LRHYTSVDAGGAGGATGEHEELDLAEAAALLGNMFNV